MSDDPIKLLEELAKRWREGSEPNSSERFARGLVRGFKICAEELHALIPTLRKRLSGYGYRVPDLLPGLEHVFSVIRQMSCEEKSTLRDMIEGYRRAAIEAEREECAREAEASARVLAQGKVRARIEEAEWWHAGIGHTSIRLSDCIYCKRIADLKAKEAELEQDVRSRS